MKIEIGNYPKRLFTDVFIDYMSKKYGFSKWPESEDYTLFEKILELWENRLQDFYNIFNWLWFDRRKQKVKIRIDPYDTWSMDNTLSHIILPMLKQLKEKTHGAPNVDNIDVPKELRPTKKELTAYTKNGDTDTKFFERWDWVLNEMIWAFEQKCRDDWESDYYSGEHDIQFKKITDGEYKGYNELKRGPKDTFKTDFEGIVAHKGRMSNGFRLFGKYFENLWD